MAKQTDESEPDYLTPGEASKMVGLSPRTLARLADSGKIRSNRPTDAHRRYARSDIEALLPDTENASA